MNMSKKDRVVEVIFENNDIVPITDKSTAIILLVPLFFIIITSIVTDT